LKLAELSDENRSSIAFGYGVMLTWCFNLAILNSKFILHPGFQLSGAVRGRCDRCAERGKCWLHERAFGAIRSDMQGAKKVSPDKVYSALEKRYFQG